jgi:hypothetical protein
MCITDEGNVLTSVTTVCRERIQFWKTKSRHSMFCRPTSLVNIHWCRLSLVSSDAKYKLEICRKELTKKR